MNLDLAVQDMWAAVRVAAQRVRRQPDLGAVLRAAPSAGDGGRPLVTCIVFSKDRGMQLDVCLRSIERMAPYCGPIIVIFRATNDEFAHGYQLLEYGSRVRMVAEGEDFREDVMDAVESAGEYTVFHTDDDVFFRPSPAAPLLTGGLAGFSLRLGVNTTYCYPIGRPQPPPAFASHGPFIAWEWTRAKHDFSYPMSLDGHIFETSILRRMLRRAHFANPNQLEEQLHRRRYLAPSVMAAFRESCLVSLPLNVVNVTHPNRAAELEEWSAASLNRRFVGGVRVDLDAMDFSDVHAAHQEIELAFKNSRLAR